jgi:hypothetical protein
MARVQLITTGVMEERALGRSLQRLFPEHEFIGTLAANAEARSSAIQPREVRGDADRCVRSGQPSRSPATRLPACCRRYRTLQRRRSRHPKRYLWYLTDPGSGGRYRESDYGVRALSDLEWPLVTRDAQRTRFARSLLADLIDMLGPPDEDIAEAIVDGETHPLTWPPLPHHVLRNL